MEFRKILTDLKKYVSELEIHDIISIKEKFDSIDKLHDDRTILFEKSVSDTDVSSISIAKIPDCKFMEVVAFFSYPSASTYPYMYFNDDQGVSYAKTGSTNLNNIPLLSTTSYTSKQALIASIVIINYRTSEDLIGCEWSWNRVPYDIGTVPYGSGSYGGHWKAGGEKINKITIHGGQQVRDIMLHLRAYR